MTANYRHKEKTSNFVKFPAYTGTNNEARIYLRVIEEVVLRVQRSVYCDRLVEEDNIIAYIAQEAIRHWEETKKKEENGGTI